MGCRLIRDYTTLWAARASLYRKAGRVEPSGLICGTAEASYQTRYEQEAARLGKSHTEAELQAERDRIE